MGMKKNQLLDAVDDLFARIDAESLTPKEYVELMEGIADQATSASEAMKCDPEYDG